MQRRDFNKLTMAALGGMLAGSAAFARVEDEEEEEAEGDEEEGEEEEEEEEKEIHVCRGLNTCKGNGADGENECAGQGTCATAEAHTCGGQNECKNQGGCGKTPGENECKEMGKCHVPLEDKAWKIARKRFEARMKKAKKKFGKAPPKEESEDE